jgi:hypothetical protein
VAEVTFTWPPGHDVREGAAAVDPEIPFFRHAMPPRINDLSINYRYFFFQASITCQFPLAGIRVAVRA